MIIIGAINSEECVASTSSSTGDHVLSLRNEHHWVYILQSTLESTTFESFIIYLYVLKKNFFHIVIFLYKPKKEFITIAIHQALL